MVWSNFLLALVVFGCAYAGPAALKKDTPVEVTVHATNRTQVEGVHVIVDAVEVLREAYSVYADDAARAKLYAELFQEKYPSHKWGVAVGYTAMYLQAEYYVETIVSGGGKKSKDLKDKKDKGTYFIIFSGP